MPVAQWLGSANSCVNPIIYCLFSKKFRQGFTVIVHCCKKTKKQSPWMRNSSLMYKSVNDKEGVTMYTTIRTNLADKKIQKHNADVSDEQTCF